MLKEKLKNYNLILASGSPRRQAYFKELDLDFKVELRPIEELYPEGLNGVAIADYLAVLKSKPFLKDLKSNDILITSDTIVWNKNKALGKPKDEKEAISMLESMSNGSHEVITSICFTSIDKQIVVNSTTKVTFKKLEKSEISFYISKYKPFDKAGAYGIQEWIGAIGITSIEGSYTNVVGLPTHLLYKTLNSIIK